MNVFCLPVYVCLPVCLPVCLSVYLSTCIYSLSVSQSVRLSVCCLSACCEFLIAVGLVSTALEWIGYHVAWCRRRHRCCGVVVFPFFFCFLLLTVLRLLLCWHDMLLRWHVDILLCSYVVMLTCWYVCCYVDMLLCILRFCNRNRFIWWRLNPEPQYAHAYRCVARNKFRGRCLDFGGLHWTRSYFPTILSFCLTFIWGVWTLHPP